MARKHFDLGIYTVACAEDKVEFAKDGCLLVDDKPSSVEEFANASPLSGGYVWPANYNEGLDESWYFKKSWLHEHKKHWALTDSDRADILKDMKPTEEKPKLDYDAMDEAKRRKMTPMYSGLLAYFPDALAMVAQNSMLSDMHQHGDR